MIPWTATITKLKSDDGFWEIQAGQFKLGDTLEVDLDSRRDQKFINRPTGTEFVCEIIFSTHPIPGALNNFIPTELLEI